MKVTIDTTGEPLIRSDELNNGDVFCKAAFDGNYYLKVESENKVHDNYISAVCLMSRNAEQVFNIVHLAKNVIVYKLEADLAIHDILE